MLLFSTKSNSVIQRAIQSLNLVLTSANVPESHGLLHAQAVLSHCDLALTSALEKETHQIDEDMQLAIRLAALLHDADDRKYFKTNNESQCLNAQKIAQEALSSVDESSSDSKSSKINELMLEMISYVSASKNGNSVPERAKVHPYLLWPRWCDRLEAIGPIGAVRCFQYNQEIGAPMSCEQTPCPKTQEEVWENVKPERFEEYMKSGGGSASMMDHYYDKLLQIAYFDPQVVQNQYLQDTAKIRVQPLVDICVQYGTTKEVPVDLIKSHIK